MSFQKDIPTADGNGGWNALLAVAVQHRLLAKELTLQRRKLAPRVVTEISIVCHGSNLRRGSHHETERDCCCVNSHFY